MIRKHSGRKSGLCRGRRDPAPGGTAHPGLPHARGRTRPRPDRGCSQTGQQAVSCRAQGRAHPARSRFCKHGFVGASQSYLYRPWWFPACGQSWVVVTVTKPCPGLHRRCLPAPPLGEL